MILIAIDSVRNTANQVIHSDEENIVDCFLFAADI